MTPSSMVFVSAGLSSSNLSQVSATELYCMKTCLTPNASLQFHILFDSLFRVLFIFPSQYLFSIGLLPIFSFRRSLPPIRAAFPNYSTLRECITETLAVHVKDGIITLSDTPSKDCGSLQFRRGPAWMTFSSFYNSDSESLPDFKTDLFPLHSQLLREYF